MRIDSLTWIAGIGAVTLAGCSAPAPHRAPTARTTAMSPATLTSHHWQLDKVYNAQGAAEAGWTVPTGPGYLARPVQLDFSAEQVLHVSRLCNVMNGRYQVTGKRIQVQRMMSALIGCEDAALHTLERKVAQTLPQAQQWQIIEREVPVLQLVFHNGARWELQGQPTHETLYGPAERVFWEIAPQTVACTAGHPQQCLQVREVQYNNQGIPHYVAPWTAFHGAIEGYQHQIGMRHVLRLHRYQAASTTFAQGRYLYVLDMHIATNPATP